MLVGLSVSQGVSRDTMPLCLQQTQLSSPVFPVSLSSEHTESLDLIYTMTLWKAADLIRGALSGSREGFLPYFWPGSKSRGSRVESFSRHQTCEQSRGSAP